MEITKDLPKIYFIRYKYHEIFNDNFYDCISYIYIELKLELKI